MKTCKRFSISYKTIKSKILNLYTMKRFAIFIVFLMLVYGCKFESTIYYKKEAGFGKFKTFAWLLYKDRIFKGNKVKEEAFHYINRCMVLKGYEMDTIAPDVLLDMQLLNENKMGNAKCLGHCPSSDYIVYFYPNNDYKFRLVNSTSYPYPQWQYELDTLVYNNSSKKRIISLNVIDRKTEQAIWSATALGKSSSNKVLLDHVSPTLQKVMENFPTR